MTVLLSGKCKIHFYHNTILKIIFRNYHPETPVDDMKKDPSFDLEKERRRTRVAPKRSLDHTVNTSASDDTVSNLYY